MLFPALFALGGAFFFFVLRVQGADGSFPKPLTPDEEAVLLRRMQQDGDAEAREKLENSEKESKENRRALRDAQEEAQAAENVIQGHSLRMDSRRKKAEDAAAAKLKLRSTRASPRRSRP